MRKIVARTSGTRKRILFTLPLHWSANRRTITGSVPILSDNTVRYAKPFIWLLTVIPLFPTSRRLRALHKSRHRVTREKQANVATAYREISNVSFHPFHPIFSSLSFSSIQNVVVSSHLPLEISSLYPRRQLLIILQGGGGGDRRRIGRELG